MQQSNVEPSCTIVGFHDCPFVSHVCILPVLTIPQCTVHVRQLSFYMSEGINFIFFSLGLIPNNYLIESSWACALWSKPAEKYWTAWCWHLCADEGAWAADNTPIITISISAGIKSCKSILIFWGRRTQVL